MVFTPNTRISAMAKDFGVKSKVITDILLKNGITGKTHTSILEPDEFSLVFEALTREHQVTNLTQYLAGEADIERDEPEPKSVASEAVAQEVPATQAQENSPKQEESEEKPAKTHQEKKREPGSRAENTSAHGHVKGEPAKSEEQSNDSKMQFRTQRNVRDRFANVNPLERVKQNEKKNERQKPQERQRPRTTIPVRPTVQRPAPDAVAISTAAEAGPAHVGKSRIVDTRTSQVDLSKYDEKLETLVPETAKNLSGEKQKLKKQNTRRPYDKRRDKEQQAMEKLRRQEAEKARRPLSITLPEEIAVNELASRLRVTSAEVIKRLVKLGVMATVNQMVDFDTAYLVADEMGVKVTKEVVVTIEERLFDESEDAPEQLVDRSPVVVVMGHVDHGKTSLLDAIRHTNVTSGEAGGITQHIGAYRVSVDDREITFLDTPGHEAFTAMRARGAKATDIAILVVAADDGIMPQTVEAINHAKAAGVSIIVAINKMDKPGANADAVKQSLTQYELVPEEWGGDTICVPVSALTKKGIPELLEMVLLVADMKELKANPNRRAKGIVIEAKLDKGRGPVATVLVQNGTLRSGDMVIAGTAVGHVRAMTNDKGRSIKEAGPSVPVEITGLSEIPDAGDEFAAVVDERMARTLADQRRSRAKEAAFKANAKMNLEDLFSQISEGVKELSLIIKADVGGSAEAVKASLEKLTNEEVRVKAIHVGVGGITENDVMLAAASNAIIVGFNVRPDKGALDSAERQHVDIRTYRIIYDCIEEISAAMKGMLAPTFKEVVLGHAEVRQTIHVPNVGTIAGSYIQDGKIVRSAQIRVVRDGIVIFEDKISSLKRFKDDVKEVAQGFECGIGLERFNDIKEGDILEAFIMEEIAR